MTHRFITLLVLLGVAFCGAHAQLSVAYVDAIYGSDSFSGTNPTDMPPGSGPKATIHAGLGSLADRGRLVIFAGTYAGDGVDTDGSVDVGTDDAAINISIVKYPRLASGLTIELRALGGNDEIRISADANTVLAPNGALITHTADQYIPNFIFDIPGGLLTITSTNGTEFFSLAGRHSLGMPVAGLFLERGTVDIERSSSFRLSNGSTISLRGSSRFAREAPQKENDLNVSYMGDESVTAGAEAAYPSFGAGVLIVAKSAGASVTFPSPMVFVGNNDAIQIRSGNALFNGSITLGVVGNQTSSPRTADIVIESNGNVTFAAPLSLVVAGGTVADSSISSIVNSGAGTVTFQKRIAWYGATNSRDATFPVSDSTALTVNSGSGSLTFSSGILLSHTSASGAAAATVEVAVLNSGRGRLSFGMPVDVVTRSVNGGGAIQQFSLAAVNNGGGTLEISGTIRSRLVNAAAGPVVGTVNITGATFLGSLGASNGVLTNAQNGVINLGPNNLTLYGSVSHSLGGSYVTSTSGSVIVAAEGSVGIDGGSLPTLSVAQPSGGSTMITKAASLSALMVNSGECRLQSSLSVTGTIDVSGGALVLEDGPGRILLAGAFRQTGGTVRVGGNSGGDLKVLGDFRRTGGSFVHGSGSSLIFAGGSSQTFHSGPSIQLSSLTVENTGGFVNVAEPVRVAGNLSFARGTRVELGNSTIVLNGGTGIFTNDGSFNAIGLGIVLGGAYSVPGGSSLIGAEIRAGSEANFSSFTVDIGTGNSCALKASAPVKWSGSLSLLSGSLDIASPHDLSPGSTQAGLVIDVARSNGLSRSVGAFNPSNVNYTLRLIGNLQKAYTLSPELAADLTNVDTLFVDVNGDTEDNDANPLTGPQQFFHVPGGVFVFGGSLQVGPLAVVRLEGDGKSGNSMELSGPSASHRIRGILTTADSGDAIVVSGEKATMIGGDGAGDVSLVGNIVVRSVTLCRISSIRGFLGTFTTSPGSSVALSMGQSSDDRRIAGGLILNGNSFMLEGELEVQGGVQFDSGVLAFGQNNLILTTKGDFLQAQGAGGYSTTGGSLVMSRPGARLRIGNTDAAGLPNLRILADTYLESPGRITKNLSIGTKDSPGIPTLILGDAGNGLTFSGSTISLLSSGAGSKRAIVSDGTSNGTPGGRLFVIGTSVTLVMNGDFTVEELVYNPPAIDGSLSILSSDEVPHVLTIGDILTHAGGQINLGFCHLALAGTGRQPGARSYNRSDGTIGASTGEVRFIGTQEQEFTTGESFSLANLRISNAAGVVKTLTPQPMIITKTLDLSEGRFTFREQTVVLENGATVIRRRSTALLANALSFRSTANCAYLIDKDNGKLTTALELPSSPGVLNNLYVNNPIPSSELAVITLDSDIGIRGTLFLDAGELDWGSKHVTLAEGATIEVRGGRLKAGQSSSGRFIVSRYNLVYRRSSFVSSSSIEFQSGSAIQVEKLSVIGSSDTDPTILYLNANKNVGSIVLDAPRGGLEFGSPGSFIARNLTIKDSLTILAGGFRNTTGANGIITLAGSNRQIVTLPDTGLTLPGGASAIHLQLNNSQGFLLRGGDLRFSTGAILFFAKGVLDAGNHAIILSSTATGQGFDRQGVVSTNVSHVKGIIRQSITGGAGSVSEYPNGRYEFPTGSADAYRPLIMAFTNSYPAKTPTLLEVSFVDQQPPGRSGLPLDGGQGSVIGGVAPFSWRVATVLASFDDDQQFDLETTLKNPAVGVSSASNLRFIIRSAASSAAPWSILGTGFGYGANNMIVTAQKDTLLVIRVTEATHGFQGTNVVTVGLPLERKPYLNYREPSDLSEVAIGQPVSFRISISDPYGLPLTVAWRVNGSTIKSGIDTSFSYAFQGSVTPQIVRAVYSNTMGFSDSTEWAFVLVGVQDERGLIQTEFALKQNYPNPFNLSTNIPVALPVSAYSQLAIYSMKGQLICLLFSGNLSSGYHVFRWDGRDGRGNVAATGTYYCRLTTGPFVKSIKLILLK